MDEFALIRRFFDRQISTPGVVTGIGDDGAVLRPAPGRDQVQVIDTLVEGVHFPADLDPVAIGYRLVAVNLSDIAAMGAYPRWMTLALTMPEKDAAWLTAFSRGLFQAADEFGVALVGGDTTRGEAVVATVHITGDVAQGDAILRSGARAGDAIFVTGTLGDAAAGLELLMQGEQDEFLIHRFLYPSARIEIGGRLAGRASAAIDVSDGLVADLSKLLDASGVGGELAIESLPMSAAMKSRYDAAQCAHYALSGGDDYELCFTGRAGLCADIPAATEIGRVTTGTGLVCRKHDVVVECDDSGYRHFR